MKRVIKINEEQLRKLIGVTVKKVINETILNPQDSGPDDYNAAPTMDWPFEKDNEIWQEIAKEGGMSWTDGNVEFKIVKEPDGGYVVYDENGELSAASMYLHKAQKGLYAAVVNYLEREGSEPEDEEY